MQPPVVNITNELRPDCWKRKNCPEIANYPVAFVKAPVICGTNRLQGQIAQARDRPRSRSEVEALLKEKAGLTMDGVMAQALALKLDEVERISGMLNG